MNEKIKELAEQACEYVEEPMPDEVYNLGDGVFRRHKTFNREKFAQLIVEECIHQVLTGIKCNPPQAEPPEIAKTLARRLQQHFGVESE
jgi:hypothetical protein